MTQKIESDITISSRVRLARNFDGYPFPFNLSQDKSFEIIEKVRKTIFTNNCEKKKFSYIDLNVLEPINKQVLVERHLISPEMFSAVRPCVLILSDDEKVGIMVNEEDHLRIQCILTGMDLNNAFKQCLEVEEIIENEHKFAFNDRYGYLTTCPTNIGTGLRASVMLHLPALAFTGQINEIVQACVRLGLTARGMYGENTEVIGNMFQISNQKTLGLNEESIINNVTNIALQIIEQEKQVRENLISKTRYRFEDKVWRALGILKNARIISSEESLRLLSDVRLGVDTGIIKDVSKSKIDLMLISIQSGSLQKAVGRPLVAEERDVCRANVIRTILEDDFLEKQKN